MNPAYTPRQLGTLDEAAVRAALQSAAGLRLRTGPVIAAIRSPLPDVARAIRALYADYPLADHDAYIDFQVGVRRPTGVRHWFKPQVVFEFDGHEPFNPLPGDQGFPLLEWGLNWCLYGLCHQYLILHAAVLERNGRALILPAPSGSGKSTLCAGLLFNGWRLLSDELTLIRPQDGRIVPVPRPVSLKNASIDVIRSFAPQARFGSVVSETSKGTVAHFAAPADALARIDDAALPGWVLMPKFTAGAKTRLQPLEPAQAFMRLVENAFNYDLFGAEGFALIGAVVDQSACFTFEYSDLHDAIRQIGALAD